MRYINLCFTYLLACLLIMRLSVYTCSCGLPWAGSDRNHEQHVSTVADKPHDVLLPGDCVANEGGCSV